MGVDRPAARHSGRHRSLSGGTCVCGTDVDERLVSDLDRQRISLFQAQEHNWTMLGIRCGADKAQGRSSLSGEMDTFGLFVSVSNFSH